MIEDLLTLERCNCGRSSCQFFAGGVGEWGSSYSMERVKAMRISVEKLKEHLDKLLEAEEQIGQEEV